MGLGIKQFCIHNEQVSEISRKECHSFTRPEFANQDILCMSMVYEIKDRRPSEIVSISFNILPFDENGEFSTQKFFSSEEFSVFFTYAMNIFGNTPLPVPRAPAVPSKKEKDLIKTFIRQKYPSVSETLAEWIEWSIINNKENHKENQMVFKASHKKVGT